MVLEPVESRRHRPQQERSREMIERMLGAAAQLFAEHGIADVSTNRIARHAGVSIGSLYRYFADKDEIVAALRTRLAAELEEGFTAAVLAGLHLEPAVAIGISLREIVDRMAGHSGLVRALAAQARVDGSAFGDLERRLAVLTRGYLLHQLGPRPGAELDVKAFVMVNVGLAACMRIGMMPPGDLDRHRLCDETAAMLAGWIEAAKNPIPDGDFVGHRYGGGVRLTDFRELVHGEFGVARGDAILADHVLPRFGKTGADAIEAGADPREVWRDMCAEFDVPRSRW